MEATSDLTEAVSVLAGMSPPAEAARTTVTVKAASSDGATKGTNQRHARTLVAMQAHNESCPPPIDLASTAAATTPAVENDDEVPPSSFKDDNPTNSKNGNNENVELEKVAAFIASYAGATQG